MRKPANAQAEVIVKLEDEIRNYQRQIEMFQSMVLANQSTITSLADGAEWVDDGWAPTTQPLYETYLEIRDSSPETWPDPVDGQ